MSGNVNGRLSFGKVRISRLPVGDACSSLHSAWQVSKKEKQRQVEDDAEPSFDDNDDSHPRRAVPGKSGRKEKKIYSISSGGAGVPDGSSIRQQQRARAAAEAGRRRDSSAMSKSDEEDPAGDVKYEEDTNFVDEMMIQARQKRQMDASHNGRKKKRKSAV